MTEQEIIRNAEEYIDENTHGVVIDTNVSNFLLDVYLAGAHSRDEEIGRMNTTIRLYANHISQLRKEVEHLRNPWISVEERLPEEPLTICAVWLNGDDLVPHISLYDSGRFLLLPVDVTVTHWMPIPELKKGE